MTKREYIAKLEIDEFIILLKEFDIEIDEHLKYKIFQMIKNNSYAIVNDQYQFIIENSIKKLTSDYTCQKISSLINHYFKPLLKI